MILSHRMRMSVAAGLAAITGLVGCSATSYLVDRVENATNSRLPSLRSISPWGGPQTPTYASPVVAPAVEPVPVPAEPLVIPPPATTKTPAKPDTRPVSTPPALPPFDSDARLPSARLFPPGPVKKMGFETSKVIRDSSIIQTGCCTPMVSSCCPTPCCPPPCCPTPCCDPCCDPCGSPCCSLSGKVLGAIATPVWAAKYGVLRVKDGIRNKLSALGSRCNPCVNPCVSCCDPCMTCPSPCSPCGVANEYVLPGVVVNEYPMHGCSTCGPQQGPAMIPMTHRPYPPVGAMPQQQWQQPSSHHVHGQRPCPCQNQQQTMHRPPAAQVPRQAYVPQPQVAPRTYQPTYQPGMTQSVQPQYQARQQPVAQPQYSGQTWSSQQQSQPAVSQPYSTPTPVEPQEQAPAASAGRPEPAPAATSSLTPGYSGHTGYGSLHQVSGRSNQLRR